MIDGTIPQELLARRHLTPSGCWEWTAHRDSNGYGHVSWRGQRHRVHRLVAHLAHGLDLSDSLTYARHTCDNPPCFNPDHLIPGTPKENQQDAIARGRRISGTCKRGHEWTSDNTFYDAGSRRCKPCARERQREWQRQQRAKGIPHPSSRTVSCPHCGKSTSAGYLPGHIRRMHKAS